MALAILCALFSAAFYGCASTTAITWDLRSQHNNVDSLVIHEGLMCPNATKVKCKDGKKTVAVLELGEPVKIAQSDQEEQWGFYQFPNIGRAEDGTLVVTWHMREDSHKVYGKGSGREVKPMISKDNGLTWEPAEKDYGPLRTIGYCGNLLNGDFISISTPQSKNIRSYKKFPKSVAQSGAYSYYPVDSLPEDLHGIYINYVPKGQKSQFIHAKLIDPGLLRNAIGDLMPVVWWGNIKQLADQSLIAGVYPANYLDESAKLKPSAVSFYRSYDNGRTWEISGKIPFHYDGIANKRGDTRYDEPTFEVLSDSTLICVMRTGSASPMYKTFSYDLGQTWTVPEPFTPNGVMPRLLLMKNNVIALTSGRPGVQLRFCFDGTGQTWTPPIDMISLAKSQGSFNQDVSCGYASMIDSDSNTLHIVYADFTTTNSQGERRKSIWTRKIYIKKQNL